MPKGRHAGSMPGGARPIPGHETFAGSAERFNIGSEIGNLMKDLPEEPNERLRREIARMHGAGMQSGDIFRVVVEAVAAWKAAKR